MLLNAENDAVAERTAKVSYSVFKTIGLRMIVRCIYSAFYLLCGL